jgi:ABC-type histidine transport system ATPase subunit
MERDQGEQLDCPQDHAANRRRPSISDASGVEEKNETREIKKVHLSNQLINLCLQNFNIWHFQIVLSRVVSRKLIYTKIS